MKQRKILFYSFILLLLIGCDGEKENVIKIGVLMPLTGNVATLGVPALEGIQLAVQEYNENKKQNEPTLEIISEDTKAQPSFGVSSINKLITTDKIKVIIGPLTSTVTLAVAPIAEKNKVVIISPGSSAPKLTDAGDYIFRNELSDSEGGKIQAKLAYDSLNFRKMAIVYINTDYGAGIYDVFNNEFKKAGGDIIYSEAFQSGATDFRSIINKIKNSRVDAVFLVGIDEMINFIEQSKQLSLNAKIFTTPIFENIEYLKKLGNLAENVIYVYYGKFDLESKDSSIINFMKKYKDKFKSNPTYYSALAYDATNIILEALRLSGFDKLSLKENLYKIRKYPGITGSTSFNRNGDVSKPVLLKTVKNGNFVYYK